MFSLNDLSDLQGASKTKIPIHIDCLDGKSKWTPIYQSSTTGSAVAAVSIAMTILHENEGKNGWWFSRLTI
mgnify:CR=1 FL=1